MHFALAVLLLMVAMAVKDILGTAMVVFEARGEGKKAGRADASSDVVNSIYTLINVDALNAAGFSWKSAIVLFAIAATSYNVTKYTTNYLAKRGVK